MRCLTVVVTESICWSCHGDCVLELCVIVHLLEQLLFWCWCCLRVNWQLRLVAFLQSTGAVAFVWRTVHSSCVLKLIFILIDFKKMFLSLKEVFMSVDCVVFVETRMLCLLRWNCLWQLVFFCEEREYFLSFLWYLWLWWRHFEGHWCSIYLSAVEAM